MTDREKWKEFFKSYGMDFAEDTPNFLTLVAGSQDNVHGYNGFELEVEFDSDSNFIGIGVWE